MRIEKAKQENYDEINIIAKEVHDLHISFRPDIFKFCEKPIKHDYFNSLLENSGLYVAKENEITIGYVIIKRKDNSYSDDFYLANKTLLIEVLGIKSEYIHKGVGTEIMNFIIKLARKENYTDIELTVSPENARAIKFYEKLGMRVKNIKYQMKV